MVVVELDAFVMVTDAVVMVTDAVDVVQAVDAAVVEVKLIFLDAGVRILKIVFPGVPVRERSDERLSLCFLLGNDFISSRKTS